jgi:hypothetical protein
MKLAASARDTATLAKAWRARASVRIAPFLDDEVARAVRDALRAQAWSAAPPSASVRLQYEVFTNIPESGCDHLTCRFARWMWDDLPAWLEAITGRRYRPPESRELVAMIYRRGSYLDPHNDRDPIRRLAFVLGLTAEWWPPEHGGHLEFLEPDEDTGLRLVERRDPGWNTLDLFAVDTHDRLHQVPQLTIDVERLTVSGWFI